jgi:glyoxylase-like metal-dependent hydrolase (beta-lactamase superfamily II)
MEIQHIKLGLNSCYLIKGDGYVMMDAGTPHKAGKFSRELKKRGIKPEEIKLIVVSHSHFDHAGSAADIQMLTGAKIAIHEKEQEYLDRGGFSMPKGVNRWGKISLPLLFPILKKIPFPKIKADILLSDQEYSLEEFGLDGSIFHTPGHTEGSVSILLKSGEAFVGCMAHNNLPFRLEPGLPIYAKDIDNIKENWKILIGKGAKTVYPGHGNPFPIEVISRALNVTKL